MAKPLFLALSCVLLGACAVHLIEPAARRCDATHGCSSNQRCDLSQDLCVALSAGDGGPNSLADGGQLTLVPGRAVVDLGATQSFAALGTPVGAHFTVEEPGGGTVDDSGLYLAPQTAGTYHLDATSAEGTSLGSAEVVVAAYPPVKLGLVAHWAADNINGQGQPLPADGAALTAWKDLVGSNDLGTLGDRTSPVFKWQGLAGNPTVSFDGVAQYLQSGVFAPALEQPTTVIVIFKTPPTPVSPTAATIFDAPLLTSERQRLIVAYGPPGGLQMFALKFAQSYFPHAPNEFLLASLQFHGGNSLQRVNQTTELQLVNSAVNGPGDAGMGGMLLGGRQGVSTLNDAGVNQFTQTEIAELLVYNRALTLNELTSVESVLAAKYQLP